MGELTGREVEVLRFTARGKTSAEIAEILDITKRTADAHKQAIMTKLKVANMTAAVAVAIGDGIITVE
jgi:LuxR family transcriptional regulator, quorum-sensing system regulator SolR